MRLGLGAEFLHELTDLADLPQLTRIIVVAGDVNDDTPRMFLDQPPPCHDGLRQHLAAHLAFAAQAEDGEIEPVDLFAFGDLSMSHSMNFHQPIPRRLANFWMTRTARLPGASISLRPCRMASLPVANRGSGD